MADLTIEEKRAIAALRRLAARWPASLALTEAAGRVVVVRTGGGGTVLAEVPRIPCAPRTPPAGWFPFGSHAGTSVPVEFSAELDDAGMPLWEKPTACPSDDARPAEPDAF